MGGFDDHVDEEEVPDESGRPAPTLVLRVLAVVPALLLVLVAGRAWLSEDNAVHADGDGILSAHAGPGAVAFGRTTSERELWGTFGSYVLCLEEDAEIVELTGYRYESTSGPRALYAGVRTLTPRQVATGAGRDKGRRIRPVGTERGRPPEFRVSGTSAPMVGSFSRGLEGVRVNTDCDDATNFGSRQMAAPMHELLVVVKAGPQGAYVTDLEIDYRADGRSYTLTLDTDLAICGSRVTVCDVQQG